MMTSRLSDNDLLSYNRQGLIPSPEEDEDAFLSRVQLCLGLKSLITSECDQLLPFKPEILDSHEPFEEAFKITGELYDICPTWLPLFFSNYQLTPWHGGCAWIFQLQETGPRTAFLQLRKAFAYKDKFLGLYPRNELVAHECAHVGRMGFDQEQFEELLAYRTSHSRLTRWLGPIVQSAKESLLFIGILIILFMLDLYFLVTENYETYFWTMGLKIIPLGLFMYALRRLWKRHHLFKRCHANLSEAVGNNKTANHIIYRLTDEEIRVFSSLSSSKIRDYAANPIYSSSLRWRVICLAYLSFSLLMTPTTS